MPSILKPKFLKLLALISSHRYVVASGLVMAFLVMLPSFLFPVLSGKAYQGIDIGNFLEDDIGYLSRGRELLEGHRLGNLTLRIGKDNPDPHMTFVEYVLVLPLKWLGVPSSIDIAALYIFYNFWGIFILILLIYALMWRLSGDKWLSLIAALVPIGGYQFVMLTPLRIAISPDINLYSRFLIPVFSSVALFVFLIFLSKSLLVGGHRLVVWTGIIFGTLFYVSAYTWTFAAALMAILVVFSALKKNRPAVKRLGIIMAMGFVLGSYIVVRAYSFNHSEIGKQSLFFNALEHSHAPGPVSKLFIVMLILFAWFAYKKKDNPHRLFILAIILTTGAVMNQQIITGQSIQPYHYYWYFNIPLSIVVGLYMVWSLLSAYPFVRRAMCIALVAVIFLNTGIHQYRGTLATKDFIQYAQNYRPIIDMLNRESKSQVILSSARFYGQLFTVYTNHDAFWGEHAFSFHTPLERMIDAMYVYVYLDREARHDFLGHITTALMTGDDRRYADIASFLVGFSSGLDLPTYKREIGQGNESLINQRTQIINDWNQDYNKKLLKDPNGLLQILKNGEVDYIVWDKNKNPEWDLTVLAPHLKEILMSNNIYLYRVVY